MRIGLRVFLSSLVAALLCGIAAQAQTQDEPAATPSAQAKKPDSERNKPATISVDQENTILAFVSKHDTSLHGLLGNLRTARPLEYQKALLDLNRTTERLAQVKRNRPHAYELEVQKWQMQSKMQMLAAKLTMNPNPETRAELRKTIKARAELELAVLKADREAAAKRMQQLDDQIAAAEKSLDNRVQLQFERSTNVARRARTSKNGDDSSKRPEFEEKKPSDKPEGEKPPTNSASQRKGASS